MMSLCEPTSCFCKPGQILAGSNVSERAASYETDHHSGLDLYSASDALPKSLVDDGKGHSYDVAQTAWQDAVGTTKPRWEWLEEHVPARELEKPSRGGYPGIFGPDLRDATEKGTGSSFVKRPEHAIFGQAMVGGGRVFGASHVYGECLRSDEGIERAADTFAQ